MWSPQKIDLLKFLWNCGVVDPENTARYYMHAIEVAQKFDRGVFFVESTKNRFADIFVELWSCGFKNIQLGNACNGFLLFCGHSQKKVCLHFCGQISSTKLTSKT